MVYPYPYPYKPVAHTHAGHQTLANCYASGSNRCFFDISNKIANNLKIFGVIDLIKYYHLIFLG